MQPSGNTNLPPTTHDEYILVINGKPNGPFSIAQLKERKIKPGDFVKTPAMDDYKEAHEIAALRQLFGFKRQPLPMQYFGSFDQRAIAAVIDWLIVLAVFVLAAFVVMLILLLALPGSENQVLRIGITIGIVALTPIAKVIYNVQLESGSKRGTIGKQLMKIRVCDLYGEQITSGQAIGRNLGKYLSTATFFIGYIMCFFTAKQQCLHDMLADTVVIKDRLDS
ncbi:MULTISPECIES: RDD family protein [unclassified Mucilaginibacter]|uniref:RDD family protein n=1 Tax=unclassified Mucilaginibacter TaxID=2617802 RepID=UPI002AC99CAF|nr:MULTISPECIES: RDD family protein [unclassified Mucilaginibacter]MEB0248510.1 RDD family protein [Mucilaginibacter sp. 5B2]MEB0280336.1 RDD family protein [Mucilaginibacter sp. 10B2]MEB0300357.1 RDD family protein [Mucilaginibacter sp. 5C4]WPX24573.1 RDD family protein [Mucilaginibacter sp. 5C4]